MKERIIIKSTNQSSKRLVFVDFRGQLPAYIAVDIHQLLKNSTVNIVSDDPIKKEDYE